MRILLLSRYDRLGASSRIRTHQYIPALASLGFDVTVAPLFSNDYLIRLYAQTSRRWADIFADYFRRATRLLKARKFDLLWIEKELFPGLPAWFEHTLGAFGIPYVVDYDDAVFHRYDLSPNPLMRVLSKKIDDVMRNAALVICGNSYLADRARSANARRVEIVPSVVDLARYAVAIPAERQRTVVGWIGSPSTAPYLELVISSLRELSQERAIQLRVIGADFASPGLDIDCRPWSEASEVREIQDIDIGIMPLFDSPWERGKCGYKLIQYMACGVPAVASDIGANQEIVVDGVNGFLATNQDTWHSAIRSLCADGSLRRTIGRQGRLTVEKSYCLQITSARIARLLRDAIRL